MDLKLLPGGMFGPTNWVDLLCFRAECQRDVKAFTFLADGEADEQTLTYGELDRQARAIGAWLESQGMRGQRALLLYPAGFEFIAAFFGCLYAGVVAVTAYPPRRNRSLDRIEAIVSDADARCALSTVGVLERIGPVLNESPALQRLQWLTTDRTPPGIEAEWKRPDVNEQSLAFLQYTSGSTGTPKGVMLTHGNLMHNSALIYQAFEHTRSTSGAYWLPNYHDMGLVGGILQPLYGGFHNVLMSPMSFLQKPVRWLQALSTYRAMTSGGPNFAYDLCLRKIKPEEREQLDLSSWRVAFNGAEPVRAETLEQFAETFAPCGFRREAFYPCFGLAEATLIVSGGMREAPPVVKKLEPAGMEAGRAEIASGGRALVSSGRNLSDERIAIVDPERHAELPEGQIGEVWVSGPSVAVGYWMRAEESRRTFEAHLEPSDGRSYLRTGDLGFFHGGELFVTGRIKDLIIVRGVNHYPQDIELTAEHAHRGLRPNCGAAFAVEDAQGREQLVLVHEIERTQMRESPLVFAAVHSEVLRRHELPLDAIVLVKQGSIPKTSSGKIQRHACRRGYLDGTLNVVDQWVRCANGACFEPSVLTTAAPVAAEKIPGSNGSHARHGQANGAAHKNGKHHHGNGHTGHSHTSHGHAGIGNSAHGDNGNGALRTAVARVRESAGDAPREKPVNVVENVLRLVAQACGQRLDKRHLDATLADLGLDSLARVELQSAIEDHFGGRMPEDVAVEIDTVRDICSAVEAHLGRPTGQDLSVPAEISPENYRFDRYPEYIRLKQQHQLATSNGLAVPFFSEQEGITADTTVIDGRTLINFSNYNYLGMTGDPVVMQSAKDAIDRYGTSVSASRLVSGQKPLHRELEEALAEWVGAEASIVYVGGHATNESTIGHLFGRGDLILHDALAHNSIVQGSILSGARRRPFPHNDLRALDRILTDLRPYYQRVLIAVEGVYSMDGDFPDLPRLIEIKERHKAFLLVDEAHSAGTMGDTGRGIAEYFGADPRRVDLWMGTLSKSYGSCGGYIAGCKAVVEYLKYTSPGFVFSVGITPSNAGAALAALRQLQAHPERVARLQARSRLFLQRARQHGLNTGWSQDSPVVPVILGNSLHAFQLSHALLQRGVNVQPIMYPAVEESAARLRFFISSCHTEEQIRYTVDATAEELAKIDPSYLRRPPAPAPHAAAHVAVQRV